MMPFTAAKLGAVQGSVIVIGELLAAVKSKVGCQLAPMPRLQDFGAKLVSHGRYVAFQMAEVAIPRHLFADILRLIAELRPPFRAGVRGSAVVCSKTIGEVCLDDEKIAIFLCAAERDGSRRGPCARHRGINDAQICQTGQIERILRSTIPVIWGMSAKGRSWGADAADKSNARLQDAAHLIGDDQRLRGHAHDPQAAMPHANPERREKCAL
jgi:hypothetical protein